MHFLSLERNMHTPKNHNVSYKEVFIMYINPNYLYCL